MIALAYGAETYKLKFGHRGGNHPVQESAHRQGGNHRAESQLRRRTRKSVRARGLKSRTINLLDGTVEGVACPTDRVFSVQYHPESAPGPQDSGYLFDAFIAIDEGGETSMPKRTDIHKITGHRLRADRHRAGGGVRLRRHAGVPRAQRRRVRGRAVQLQPGNDHDGHRHCRQGIHGAADARIRRQNPAATSGRTRFCPASAGRRG